MDERTNINLGVPSFCESWYSQGTFSSKRGRAIRYIFSSPFSRYNFIFSEITRNDSSTKRISFLSLTQTKFFIAILLFTCIPSFAQNYFTETFENPNNWQHYEIAEKPSNYQIFKDKEGAKENSYLKLSSNNGSSMLMLTRSFKWSSTLKLNWSWWVDNVYQKGDLTTQSGDDYPISILIFFKYDLKNLSTIDEMNYNIWKNVTGKEPPHSTLRFVWANKEHKQQIHNSPSPPPTEKIIILESGCGNCKEWKDVAIDVLAYYKKAFGKLPPEEFEIGVLNDSDNTGEVSVSYLDNFVITYE